MTPSAGLETRSLPDRQLPFDEPSEHRATPPLLADPGQDETREEPPSGRFVISAAISTSSAKRFPSSRWTGLWYSPKQCLGSRNVWGPARMSTPTR